MKKSLAAGKAQGALHTFLVLLVLALFLTVMGQTLSPKGRVSCSDFGAYADALAAFRAGAYQLDGDGDGIPCEGLYNKH